MVGIQEIDASGPCVSCGAKANAKKDTDKWTKRSPEWALRSWVCRIVSGDGGLGGRVSAHITDTVEKALVDMSEDLEDQTLSGSLVSKVKGGRINEG